MPEYIEPEVAALIDRGVREALDRVPAFNEAKERERVAKEKRHSEAALELAKVRVSGERECLKLRDRSRACEARFREALAALNPLGAERTLADRAYSLASERMDREEQRLFRELERTADPAIDAFLASLDERIERARNHTRRPGTAAKFRELVAPAYGYSSVPRVVTEFYDVEKSARRALEVLATVAREARELKCESTAVADLAAVLRKLDKRAKVAMDLIKVETEEVA